MLEKYKSRLYDVKNFDNIWERRFAKSVKRKKRKFTKLTQKSASIVGWIGQVQRYDQNSYKLNPFSEKMVLLDIQTFIQIRTLDFEPLAIPN